MADRNSVSENEIKQIIKKRGGYEYKLDFDLITRNEKILENCIEYVADELCNEGVNDDGEINQYGEHLEILIDYLLHYKFDIE